MNRFRTLRADEIDCRVSQVKEKGVLLLLYKDARCDQTILDETVGPMNWQRFHSRDNANCTVSIWDAEKQMWIAKEDTGTESRTEKEKGLASDSFKRACFNWGIGRELYTAPTIFVRAENCNIRDGKCYDRFTVEDIEYQPDGQREIRKLVIYNEQKKAICYKWEIGQRKAASEDEPQQQKPAPTPAPTQKPTPATKAEPEPIIDETGEEILCQVCHRAIVPHKDSRGKNWTITELIDTSKRYAKGLMLCPDCLKLYMEQKGKEARTA